MSSDTTNFRGSDNMRELTELENQFKEFDIKLCANKQHFNPSDFLKGTEITINEDLNFDKDDDEDDEDQRAEILKYLKPECSITSEDNTKQPFELMAEKMVPLTEDNGVLKRVIKESHNVKIPQDKHLVTIHYNAYFEFQDEPFDSSRLRSQPYKCVLGEGKVIIGLEIGIKTMKLGEIAQFILKPEYAYGKMGVPPRIPPSATVLYEVELINILDSSLALEFDEMSLEERLAAPFEKVLQAVKVELQMGNDYVKKNNYRKALVHYKRGMRFLEDRMVKDEDEDKRRHQYLLRCYLNASFCKLNLGNGGHAIFFARKALEIDSKNVKALYRYGKGLVLKNCLNDAKKMFLKVLSIEPNNKDTIEELSALNHLMLQNFRAEKEYCQRMFGNDSKVSCPKEYLEEASKEIIEKTKQVIVDFVDSHLDCLPLTNFSQPELDAIKRCAEGFGIQLLSPDKDNNFYRLVKLNNTT